MSFLTSAGSEDEQLSAIYMLKPAHPQDADVCLFVECLLVYIFSAPLLHKILLLFFVF